MVSAMAVGYHRRTAAMRLATGDMEEENI